MSGLGVVVAGYFLGSIPFSYLLVRFLTGGDVRSQGSRSAGATNVSRAAGWLAGAGAVALDAGKGAAAVVLAAVMVDQPAFRGAAAAAAVVGHIWPVFLRFRGGKGAATAGGALAVLAPMVTLLAVVVLLVVIAWKRYVSLGTMVMAAATPLLALLARQVGWVHARGDWLPLSVTAMALLILLAHRANFQRLRDGAEPKLGQRHEELPQI